MSPANPAFPTRRRFLAQATGTLFAAPFITSGMRAASPNGKLRHASFGAAGMAMGDMKSLSNHTMLELVAVCDVDTRNFAAVKTQWPEVRCYQDWQELLEKESSNIDSVNVSTPDHMHGPIGLKAMAAGKHLYGQKPLAQNLHECRQLMLKARETGVMTQMGIQVSSNFTERMAVDMIQSGIIGKVKEVHTFSNKFWGDMEPVPQKSDPVPAEMDWQKWLGTATDRSFIEGYYHPAQWRKRRDFGTGTLGDMGCHMFSGWFRALDLAAPISVKSIGPAPLNETNWAINAIVEYTFKGTAYTAADTVKVTWYDGDARPPAEIMSLAVADLAKFPGQGSIYIGTDGVLLSPHLTTPTLYPREKFTGFKYPKLEPRNHYLEFVDCCLKGGAKPSANFDYAGPLTEAVLLGCLASNFPGQDLQWDAPALKIPNSEAANTLVKRQYRPGTEV
ncbi:putative dehydrogenase [Prosthecobacter fusiformis]|uniref:Putative dehydrogenase n=1 Tax=Prosthecobacter fusiformis TaxID=48464 RepID=A0A4R7SPX1_9BACT|nr:Gfo/Idh/MocA family oxidoreductase [Prosthecobacter fusiformis]TDU80964.1 putative dehydrogenase [Prosthecobacter fusiformis]